jgi:hypothetical protein
LPTRVTSDPSGHLQAAPQGFNNAGSPVFLPKAQYGVYEEEGTDCHSCEVL